MVSAPAAPGRAQRKLASVQQVEEVAPIDGADAIERVRVLGWWVVVKKGEYLPGDRVVYCEIDALLPERAEFEFLRKSCWRGAIQGQGGVLLQRAGFRIKTVRLRGQVSQGICFPLSVLPAGAGAELGADVTDILDIIKFDPPLPLGLSGRLRGLFPGFVPKTDEPRVQVVGEVLARHRGRTLYLTEKLDGTSFTAFVRGDQFGICSRNQWLDETDLHNGLCKAAADASLAEKLTALRNELGFDLALQAELIGPGVQGNKYALRSQRLYAFNLVNLATYRLEPLPRLLDACARLGIECVPQLGTLVLDHSVDQLVELSIGASALHAATPREGIVLRAVDDVVDPEIGRLSFKVISPKFLLKYDE
jgi:RNA ligase (TIGR02306 family)